jgi:NAD-dependent DNA ligase
VVVGEDPGSKFEEAKKLGIQTIDEAAFKRMISS